MVDNHTDSAMLEGRGEDGGTEGWDLRCQFSKGGGGFVTFLCWLACRWREETILFHLLPQFHRGFLFILSNEHYNFHTLKHNLS